MAHNEHGADGSREAHAPRDPQASSHPSVHPSSTAHQPPHPISLKGSNHREVFPPPFWTGASKEAALEAEHDLIESKLHRASWRAMRPSILFKQRDVRINTVELLPKWDATVCFVVVVPS